MYIRPCCFFAARQTQQWRNRNPPTSPTAVRRLLTHSPQYTLTWGSNKTLQTAAPTLLPPTLRHTPAPSSWTPPGTQALSLTHPASCGGLRAGESSVRRTHRHLLSCPAPSFGQTLWKKIDKSHRWNLPTLAAELRGIITAALQRRIIGPAE